LLLAQVETNGFPSWVRERLQKNVADNALRFERVKSTYQEAAAALDQAGVDYMLLKGFTQTPEYVRDARLRMQSDLDLYCPKEMISRAQAALQSIGYEPELSHHSNLADHLPAMVRRGDWQWRGNSFDPNMPLSIELHFCLWNEAVSFISLPETDLFWERHSIRRLDGISFSSLNRVDHLGYVALHILRCLFFGDWIIHHVHELATFLHRHADDDQFWNAWKVSHSSSLRTLQAIAFFHARSWFCCDIHENVAEAIHQLSPEIQEWLARFTGSSLEGMFRENKDSVWLHTSLLKEPAQKREVLKRAFLPTRVPGIGTPAARLKNRQPRRTSHANPRVLYFTYLVSRILERAQATLTTLYHGLAWSVSSRRFKNSGLI
jgi:hypothetical protein